MKRALIILDHGSRRAEAHAHLAGIADSVRSRAPELCVYLAHLELAAPSLAEAVDRAVAAGATHIAIHPFFLAPGRHLLEDIPELVAAAETKHGGVQIELLTPIGEDEALADLIVASLGEPPEA